MRFGVIGLGSMGKRRVRDLAALGHDVSGYDIRADRVAEAERLYDMRTVPTGDALIASVDAVVISTPPDQHVSLYERCFAGRRPFFSEANVFTPRAEWFAERESASGVRGYASATWMHYPLLDALRERLGSVGRDGVMSVHHHYGGWLPYWHPWEHYRDFYAGRRETSAAREMVPFEMEWICGIAGDVRAVSASRGRAGDWETDIDDQYFINIEFVSGRRGTLAVELHQAAPFRITRLSCAGHSFALDFARHELEHYEQAGDSWRRIRPPGLRTFGSFNFEDVYAAEISAFAAAAAERRAPQKTWAEDRHLSNILFAAEESARRGASVTIEEAESLYDGLTL